MKTKKNLSILILVCIVSIISGFTYLQLQEDPFITQIKLRLEKFYLNKPWEKVYLHVDKPFYKPGEDIWFKAYLIDGTDNKPSEKSDIVYVELINPKGTTEKKLTLQTLSGICFGTFNIGESAPGGIYKIRAYTNWMHNFGDDYIFEKEFQVQNIIYPRLLFKFDFLKENYSPGDSVNAELKVESLNNVPLTFQRVEVDLSLQGNRYKSLKITTDNKGLAKISFKLPDDLASNDGLVNARIAYQGNTESISRSIPIVLNNISLRFFPEGGNLISDVSSNVAFQALNEFGKPADIEGYISTLNDVPLEYFSSFHQGMGTFRFTPQKGEQYYVHITKPNIKKIVKLPASEESGYNLQVLSEDNNNYKAIIHTPSDEKVHLTVQSGKTITFSSSPESINRVTEVQFSADDFRTGVGLVTLFDNNGLARCERLVFFNYNRKLDITLKFDKEKYLPREKVRLQIQTKNYKKQGVAANLSLSVVNDQLYTFADDKEHNISSWLLLGSEVKGKIYEPNFYFDPKEKKAEKALDYLLLVQGWRRYSWDEVDHSQFNYPFTSEKVGDISGRVINSRTGKPVQADVYAVEMSNLKRIIKVKTENDGKFCFYGADASSAIQILANSKHIEAENLAVELSPAFSEENNRGESINNETPLVPEVIKIKAFEKEDQPETQDKKNKLLNNLKIDMPDNNQNNDVAGNDDIVLKMDMTNLDEVVVVGYGVQKKRDLTGAIAMVQSEDLNMPIENALQGRVAGVQIINNNNNPGAATQVKIRGAGSITNNSNPLYIIDGVIFDPNISGNTLPIQNLASNRIKSIEILKDANSTAVYGCRGVNGVVIIETTDMNGYSRTILKPRKPKYAGVYISPRQLSCTKEFYYPVYDENNVPDIRDDFRSTVYWNPNINTNSSGEAMVEFNNSDEITSFRAIIEGIGKEGSIGRAEDKYYVQMPFSLAAKFPAYLTFNDTVLMPLIVKNNTNETIEGKFSFVVPKELSAIGDLPENIKINPNEAFTLAIPFAVNNIASKDTLQIFYQGQKYSDAFKQPFEVVSKGFPVKLSASGKEKERNLSFVINKPITGSINAEFIAYSDIINDLLSGVESILQEPYGCFEQTSSSTYPNIMVLKYMQEVGNADKKIEQRAKELVKRGYDRLVGFETPENGYEWFGGLPAHNGLTAYGFMEFTDMTAIFKGVNSDMMDRTLNKLLSQRDGKGGFKKDTRALDQFGSASETVTNAYIVYALSQSGIKGLEKEYKTVMDEAIKSRDPYRLSLIANAAFNFGNNNDGEEILELIKSELSKKNWDKIQIDHSITRSYGKSLIVESASLYALALLKAPESDWASIEQTIKYITSSREYGGFGSTQATILALKALSEFTKLSKQTSGSGDIKLFINGGNTVSLHYEKGDKGKIKISNLEKFLTEGENSIEIQFENTETPLPFSFDASWNCGTPQSDKECKTLVKTSLSEQQVKVGETVRLHVDLENKTNDGIPMTLAVIGIPSGLSVQPWQLKEMQEKKFFDYYEISKNYLVIYYRQMKPSENKSLNFDLKAEIPGIYQAPASTSYLYYTKEFKYWVDGERISIVGQ